MLVAGVVRPRVSPYISLVILVQKKAIVDGFVLITYKNLIPIIKSYWMR